MSGSRLASPGTVRSLLRAYGVQVKKRYGQNFLIDANILNRIVEAAELGPDDTVLEIGPGVGVLTEAMARRAGVSGLRAPSRSTISGPSGPQTGRSAR